MIDKILLENFKAFETAEIKIKPITVLVGTNNSGKTSLMQSIGLIQQTLIRGCTEILTFRDRDNLDLGDFDAVLHQNAIQKYMRFKFDFSDGTYFDVRIGKNENSELYVKNFACNNGKFEYVIGDIIREQDKNKEKPEYYVAKEFQFNSRIYDEYKNMYPQLKPFFYRENFFFRITLFKDKIDIDKLLEDFTRNLKTPESGEKKIRKIFVDLMNFFLNMQTMSSSFYENIKRDFDTVKYIGPIRDTAHRSYEIRTYNDVGFTGKDAVQILAQDTNVKSNVETYFKNMGFATSLQVPMLGNKKNFEVKLKTKITDKEVNFADVGCGTAQILPVIVQSLITKKESLIIVEQPEAHLHPKIQADLADFFINFASNERRFLLETHSDYFIERLRYGIMNGTLLPENIAIYYVEQDETKKSSTITKIELNSKGQYSNLPSGYITNFRLEETREMTKKLLEKLKE